LGSSGASLAGRALRWPQRWWARQSLRARLTLLATALFTVAVGTGAVLLVVLQGYSLTRVLDQSALKTGRDLAKQIRTGRVPTILVPTTGGITAVQLVDGNDNVESASPGTDQSKSLLSADQLSQVRSGSRIEIPNPTSEAQLRVVGDNVGTRTILVFTDVSRVEDSQRILTEAALIGSPLAVLLMAVATYGVVTLSLRPVAALRHGAADITAAGLAEQRLPLPSARDEIHRLAVTLNAMLDRIDSATSRQRTFVGDAAHELRSPLASLRVQLEVARRLGPEADWTGLIDDVLLDAERLDRLVADLLTVARLDETGQAATPMPVRLDELVEQVAAGYQHARVPLDVTTTQTVVEGDSDALRRVAINLIDNAVRHAAAAVTVTVETGIRNKRPVAVLTVTDDGRGIPEAERQRVFDRFYRLQESRSRQTGGTGLGLPIARDIVRNHHGRIRLTERGDGEPGVRAVVVLPLADGSP
jgi:signal transduction histidine kinase